MSVQHHHAPVQSIQASIENFAREYAANFSVWRNRRKAYKQAKDELYTCDDRQLRELGISAYDIPRIAREEALKRFPR